MIEIKRMLIVDEGIRHDAYTDTRCYVTIGIGHCITTNPVKHILGRDIKLGDSITTEEITKLYEYDIAEVIRNLKMKVPGYEGMNEKYKTVLINMCFNMGITSLLKFQDMLKAMRNNDSEHAILELKDSKYAKQVPNRVKRLILILNDEEPREYK